MSENDPFAKQDKKVDETRDEKGRFADGNPKPLNSGRKIGTPNKFTTLKQAYLDAFLDEEIGGTKGLIEVFKKTEMRKIEFFKLIAKMLPTNVDVGLTGDTTIRVITALPRPVENKPKPEEEK